jgi:hypothetical protein
MRQMAQHTAANPTVCSLGAWGRALWTQIQYWFQLLGLQSTPSEYAIKRQTYLAVGHSKNRWWLLSFSLQKAQEVEPFHLRLTKLSLVRITFWETSHIKIFIFRGILAFQIILKLGPNSWLHRCLYMDFTVKVPLLELNVRNITRYPLSAIRYLDANPLPTRYTLFITFPTVPPSLSHIWEWPLCFGSLRFSDIYFWYRVVV